MQLGIARLCLDCDEVHDQERCPACASEAFAFLTRWVRPAPSGKRTKASLPADQQRETMEKLDAYRQLVKGDDHSSRAARFLRNGAMLLATIGLARWGWQQTRQADDSVRSKTEPPSTGS
jgi:hypothetical protein